MKLKCTEAFEKDEPRFTEGKEYNAEKDIYGGYILFDDNQEETYIYVKESIHGKFEVKE